MIIEQIRVFEKERERERDNLHHQTGIGFEEERLTQNHLMAYYLLTLAYNLMHAFAFYTTNYLIT